MFQILWNKYYVLYASVINFSLKSHGIISYDIYIVSQNAVEHDSCQF